MKRKKENNKPKLKTKPLRVFTQDELKGTYNVVILRQPRDEVLVFDIKEYLGTRLMKNNTMGGAYEATHWLGTVRTWNSVHFEPGSEKRGLLEIPQKRWDEALQNTCDRCCELGKEFNEHVPDDMTGPYTIVADRNGQILSILEGDHLDETLSDTAVIIEDEI